MTARRGAGLEVLLPALVALGLGLITLGAKAWWFDEAFDVSLARTGWIKYVGKAAYYEPSQALYLVIFKIWRTFTPETEWFTRLPSVAAATVAAALVGVLGTRLFNRTTGIVAGVLMATNATIVAWSQQTRTYALAALAAVAVTFFLLRAVESNADRRAWLPYAIAGGAGIYAHFFVGFVVASHAVLIPRLSALQRRRLFESWAVVGIAVLPAAPFVMLGGRGGADWIPATSLHGVWRAVSEVGGFNGAALAAAVIGAVIVLAPRAARIDRWKGLLLVSWAVVPFVGALFVSLLKPMLVGRYLIVSTPALALLGALALVHVRPRWIGAVAAAAVLALSGREVVNWYRAVPEDWRGASHFAAAEMREGTTLALYPAGSIDAYQLYEPLPPACHKLAGHAEPRCDFRAAGRKTLVLTTTPGSWRQLPGSQRYVFVDQRRFGDRIYALRLVRK